MPSHHPALLSSHWLFSSASLHGTHKGYSKTTLSMPSTHQILMQRTWSGISGCSMSKCEMSIAAKGPIPSSLLEWWLLWNYMYKELTLNYFVVADILCLSQQYGFSTNQWTGNSSALHQKAIILLKKIRACSAIFHCNNHKYCLLGDLICTQIYGFPSFHLISLYHSPTYDRILFQWVLGLIKCFVMQPAHFPSKSPSADNPLGFLSVNFIILLV